MPSGENTNITTEQLAELKTALGEKTSAEDTTPDPAVEESVKSENDATNNEENKESDDSKKTDAGKKPDSPEAWAEHWKRFSRLNEGKLKATLAERDALAAEVEELRAEAEKGAEYFEELTALKSNALKERLLSEAGLPVEAATLLRGDNEEELQLQVETLKAITNPSGTNSGATSASILGARIPQGLSNGDSKPAGDAAIAAIAAALKK